MNEEYLPTGFTNVDATGDSGIYASCLSLIDSLPYYQECKRKSYELLELAPGGRVLDAGCGLGEDVFRMAELVVPGGSVTGVDASSALIGKAKSDSRARALPVDFVTADLRALPFPEKTFGHCRIDRVLQHLREPQSVVSELARVLEPNGLLLAYDNDWGTFSVTSGNRRVTRLLENAWSDSFMSGWIGRELQGHFVETGLKDVRVFPSTSVIADYETADQIYNLRQTVERTVAAGAITADEGSEWLLELRSKTQQGCFAAALTAYTVVGRKAA